MNTINIEIIYEHSTIRRCSNSKSSLHTSKCVRANRSTVTIKATFLTLNSNASDVYDCDTSAFLVLQAQKTCCHKQGQTTPAFHTNISNM